MTHLRKMMLDELQRLNYSQSTIRHYIRTVEDFARRFRCSPDRLGPRHIREYQAELFQKRKLSANSVGQHLAALRASDKSLAFTGQFLPLPIRREHPPRYRQHLRPEFALKDIDTSKVQEDGSSQLSPDDILHGGRSQP